jgi:bifunctional DNA-binding transcriptional regulator/antitoxin component of YhaV-PrlF toxin-antitoxin module
MAMLYLFRKREEIMGFETKVQVIQRRGKNRQYYFICPAPLAEALEIKKSETVEWVVEDKYRLTIKRIEAENTRREGTHEG